MRATLEHDFRAMNTDVHLLIVPDGRWAPSLLERATGVFGIFEMCLSRFDPESELCALNRAGELPFAASPLLWEALLDTASLIERTRGLFNPAILGALEAAGYDRSFEHLASAPLEPESATRVPEPNASTPVAAQPFELDHETHTVRLGRGVRLDLGGIGKGLAVDAAADILSAASGYLVDAGGDIRVGGAAPEGGPWGIAVQNPRAAEQDIAVLALQEGAVATSSVARRRWLSNGAVRQHLIDPRTGVGATSDVLAATVSGTRCAEAEVWAKVAVIAGAGAGLAMLEREQLAGLIVDTSGRLHANALMQSLVTRAQS